MLTVARRAPTGLGDDAGVTQVIFPSWVLTAPFNSGSTMKLMLRCPARRTINRRLGLSAAAPPQHGADLVRIAAMIADDEDFRIVELNLVHTGRANLDIISFIDPSAYLNAGAVLAGLRHLRLACPAAPRKSGEGESGVGLRSLDPAAPFHLCVMSGSGGRGREASSRLPLIGKGQLRVDWRGTAAAQLCRFMALHARRFSSVYRAVRPACAVWNRSAAGKPIR